MVEKMPKPMRPKKIERARRSLIRDYFRGINREHISPSEIKRVLGCVDESVLEKLKKTAVMELDAKEVRERSQNVARSHFAKAFIPGMPNDRAKARLKAELREYDKNRLASINGERKSERHRWEDSVRRKERALKALRNPTATELERLQNMKVSKEAGKASKAKKARPRRRW